MLQLQANGPGGGPALHITADVRASLPALQHVSVKYIRVTGQASSIDAMLRRAAQAIGGGIIPRVEGCRWQFASIPGVNVHHTDYIWHAATCPWAGVCIEFANAFDLG